MWSLPGAASAPAPFAEFFPPDYFGRFAARPPEFGLTSGDLGVRAFPLPVPGADLRLDLRAHPAYTEYGLSTRLLDTSLALGVFQNTDLGATQGVPMLAAVHDPASGVQATFALRGAGRLSEGRLGYAQSQAGQGQTGESQAARLLGEVGYGRQNEQSSAFAHVEATFSRGVASGPFAATVAASGRLYLFPAAAQGSLDLYAAVAWQVAPALQLRADHFERVVAGEVSLPALGLAPQRVSHLYATFAPDLRAGPFRLVSAGYALEYLWSERRASVNSLALTGRLAVGPFDLEFTPRYDLTLNVPGANLAVLYRFSGFALGPSVDLSLVGGVLKTSFGLAFGAR